MINEPTSDKLIKTYKNRWLGCNFAKGGGKLIIKDLWKEERGKLNEKIRENMEKK